MTPRRPPAFTDVTARPRDLLGAAAIVIATFSAALAVFGLVWHRDAVADIARQPGSWAGAVLLAACSAVVHETLHGLAWIVFGGVPRQSVSVRPTWRVMGFTADLQAAVQARAYRAGAALPALVLALGPIAVGLAAGSGLLVLWGLFCLLECFSDLAALLAMRGIPPRALVTAHPEQPGCRMLA